MSFGDGHSAHRSLLNRFDSSFARLGRARVLLRIRYCRRGLMLSGPPCHSMSAFYRTGRFGRFLLGCICFWGEIKSPRQGEKPQLGGKPIVRALAVLDTSSLSRNCSGILWPEGALGAPVRPSALKRKRRSRRALHRWGRCVWSRPRRPQSASRLGWASRTCRAQQEERIHSAPMGRASAAPWRS